MCQPARMYRAGPTLRDITDCLYFGCHFKIRWSEFYNYLSGSDMGVFWNTSSNGPQSAASCCSATRVNRKVRAFEPFIPCFATLVEMIVPNVLQDQYSSVEWLTFTVTHRNCHVHVIRIPNFGTTWSFRSERFGRFFRNDSFQTPLERDQASTYI